MTQDLLTTGEVARILKISRSTVSRNYDRGIFEGQTNPITGERRISRESVLTFIQKHRLPISSKLVEKRKVLLGTSDNYIRDLVRLSLSKDSRIKLESVEQGCDILIAFSRDPSDLLIIDESLKDIKFSNILKSLSKLEGRNKLKILCLTRKNAPNDLGQLGTNKTLKVRDLNEQVLTKTILAMLRMSKTSKIDAESFEHTRKWSRISVNLPAKVEIYRIDQPNRREVGVARVKDLSEGGAYLSEMNMDTGYIPGKAFRLRMEIDHPELENFTPDCNVVRLHSNKDISAGVSFIRLTKSDKERIKSFMAKFEDQV